MSEQQPFVHETRVPYDFTDAQGRVFYANYWRLADAGRYAFWMDGLGFDDRRVVEVEDGFFIAHLECDYHGAAAFWDRLAIAVEPSDLGRTSLRIGYRIAHAATGATLFTGASVVVWADRSTDRPAPWPEWVREALLRHLGPSVLRA